MTTAAPAVLRAAPGRRGSRGSAALRLRRPARGGTVRAPGRDRGQARGERRGASSRHRPDARLCGPPAGRDARGARRRHPRNPAAAPRLLRPGRGRPRIGSGGAGRPRGPPDRRLPRADDQLVGGLVENRLGVRGRGLAHSRAATNRSAASRPAGARASAGHRTAGRRPRRGLGGLRAADRALSGVRPTRPSAPARMGAHARGGRVRAPPSAARRMCCRCGCGASKGGSSPSGVVRQGRP